MTGDRFKELAHRSIKEFLKMYSNAPSVFSKKRFEGGIAYYIAQIGMVTWFVIHLIKGDMSVSDLLLWASTEFLVDGYNVYHTQKEKLNDDGKGGAGN